MVRKCILTVWLWSLLLGIQGDMQDIVGARIVIRIAQAVRLDQTATT